MPRGALNRRATLVALGALVLAASAEAATVTEFRVPTQETRLSDITRGPDGALWFTQGSQEGTDRIGRITTAGAVTSFPVPTDSSDAKGIVTGPDGALWFTESRLSQIGRITPAGAITEFPLPGGPFNVEPNDIAAGPDGALWFTEVRGGKIGRITTAGAITEFPLPTGSQPPAIAAGPDGALWFTDEGTDKIGRITTAGAITEFAIPGAGSARNGFVFPTTPGGITAGPDGALWFTQGNPNRIGRITTAGAVTQFRIPTRNSQPGGIVTGPDGALWFTEAIGNKIARITTAGAITELRLPAANSLPEAIALGPDRALWFIEEDRDRIGRLTTARPRISLKRSPATGCVGSAITVKVNVAGAGSLTRLDLSLNGRRLTRTRRPSLRLRLDVRDLRPGTYTLRAVAVDATGDRAKVARTFRRCGGMRHLAD